MASSLSPGSRVPVLYEQGVCGRMEPGICQCPTHPHGLLTPPQAQGHPYLCATLPFLMSEMVRGSPRFLLAAGGREAMTQPWAGGTQDWGMDMGPRALLPLLPGRVAVSRSAHLSVPQFPFCKGGG